MDLRPSGLQLIKAFAVELVFLLAIAVAFLWNSALLDIQPGSELHHLEAAKELLLGGHWLTPHFNQSPDFQQAPLMTWLSGISMAVFGIKLWAARLPAILLSLCTLVLTYLLAMSLFRSRAMAILSAMALGTMWGFFRFGHYATEDTALSALLLGFLWLVRLWLPLATRKKSLRVDTTPLSITFGLLLGLMFLAKGTLGVLFPVGILLVFLLRAGAVECLSTLAWKPLLITLLLVALPWPLLVSLQTGQIDFLFNFVVGLPMARLLGQTSWAGAAWESLFFVKALVLMLLPYVFFLTGLFLDGEQRLAIRRSHDEPLQFLGVWLAVAFLGCTLTATQESSAMLMFLPALALMIGLYMGHFVETNLFSNAYRWAVDLSILGTMVAAIVMTTLFFQLLPDQYAMEFWSLPGSPALSFKIKDFELFFPLWKLWLVPGPFIMLAGGVALYCFRIMEKPQVIGLILSTTLLTFFLFLKGVYLPIVNRPVLETYARFINKQSPNGQVLIYDSLRRLPTTLFYLDYQPGRPALLFNRLGSFQKALLATHEAESTPDSPGFGRIGVIHETDYYRLSPATRSFLRIDHNNWLWDVHNPSAFIRVFRNLQPNFADMTYRVLLFDVPPKSVAETSEPAIEALDTPLQDF